MFSDLFSGEFCESTKQGSASYYIAQQIVTMPKSRSDNSYVDAWKTMWEPDLDAIAYNGATCDPTRVDPKVLDWVRENCGDKPHFVKVININAANGQPGLLAGSSACLAVPGPFVRENFRNLQRVVTLDNGKGRKWKVSFKSVGSRAAVWLRGWRIVARDNDLKPGDVMVFTLVGISHFHITIFDKDGNISHDSTSTLKNAGREFKKEFCYSSGNHQKLPSTTKSNDSLPMRRTKREYFSSDSDTQDSADFEESEPVISAAPYDEPANQLQSFEQILKPSASKRRRPLKLADFPLPTINVDTESEDATGLV